MLYSKYPSNIFRLLACKNITSIFVFVFLVFIFILQTVYNSNVKVAISPLVWQNFQVPFFQFDNTDSENLYRKTYNLVEGYPEPVTECTLGTKIKYYNDERCLNYLKLILFYFLWSFIEIRFSTYLRPSGLLKLD